MDQSGTHWKTNLETRDSCVREAMATSSQLFYEGKLIVIVESNSLARVGGLGKQ